MQPDSCGVEPHRAVGPPGSRPTGVGGLVQPRIDQIDGGFAGTESLLLSNTTNTGGTCVGDSGGPNFISTTATVGGVTSFGLDGTCGGTGGVDRVDRPDDLAWLNEAFGKLLR